jgi:hypothetical protein
MRTESLTDPVSRRSFETALEVAGENEEAVAVHAWVYREGRWVPHAWCEIDGFAVDLTRSTQASAKADYYLRMGIMPLRCRTYTRLEFFEQMADQGHLGPFDQTFFFAPESDKDPVEELLGTIYNSTGIK